MLQNSSVTAFTVFELLRENQLEGQITHLLTSPRLGLKSFTRDITFKRIININVAKVVMKYEKSNN